jgi:hypothetical protein
MDPAVIVTLVVSVAGVIFASVTAPLILARRTDRIHREDQLADYKRQDMVAAAAHAAAMAAQTAATAAQTQAAATDVKLDDLAEQTKRIHTLVNSDMTAARQEELNQAESVIVITQRVIKMTADKGLPVDAADAAILAHAKERRDQLEMILADRLAQFKQSQSDAESTEAGRHMLEEDGEAHS